MKVSELIEKLKELPQDAYVITGADAEGYANISIVSKKISLAEQNELWRYELGIKGDEEIESIPVITIEPAGDKCSVGEELLTDSADNEKYILADLEELKNRKGWHEYIRSEFGAAETAATKPQWLKTDSECHLILHHTGHISIVPPDYYLKHKNMVLSVMSGKNIKAVDSLLRQADMIIDGDAPYYSGLAAAELARLRDEMQVRNRQTAVEYLNDGLFFSPAKPVDVCSEIRRIANGDYSQSVQVYIGHFIDIGYGRENYEAAKREEQRLTELAKNPDFSAWLEDTKLIPFPVSWTGGVVGDKT